jgi:hypothetical protein
MAGWRGVRCAWDRASRMRRREAVPACRSLGRFTPAAAYPPPRSAEWRQVIRDTAHLYGLSEATLYRARREQLRPRALHRADYGQPRVMPQEDLERYCEIIAALKVRTANAKGRHVSTAEALWLLEYYGVETPAGYIQAPAQLLTKMTVNRYLTQWGYDRATLLRQLPAVRFQATHSNECWHFALSPSDLKHVPHPAWMQEGRGHPLLMLYSVVDDRSGVAYQEYHGVYGEDVEAALRFLFAALAPKAVDTFPLQGIPQMLYRDKGPIARSQVFQQVRKPTPGYCTSSCAITPWTTGVNPMHALRIGRSIFHSEASGPCAVGNAAVPSLGNPNGAKWAGTHVSPWMGSRMKSIRI